MIAARRCRPRIIPAFNSRPNTSNIPSRGRRLLQISSETGDSFNVLPPEPPAGTSSPDASFEVTAPPYALLSATLSASQNLYTRKGSLVAVGGRAENAVSTLSILEPFRRALVGIPFLYQRIASTTPLTLFISTRSLNTSMIVVRLDGTTDWMLAGKSLLAWTGQTLAVKPVISTKMSLAHWGSSTVTGRGLLALVGRGSISEVQLQQGESYIVHPSHVVGYSMNRSSPLPYRLRSSSLRLQIPDVSAYIPETRFMKTVRESTIWQAVGTTFSGLRTWTRATIFGDRLFLQFHGPTTILLQTRAARLRDVLESRDINEIADTEPGAARSLVTSSSSPKTAEHLVAEQGRSESSIDHKAPKMRTASIGTDGKVTFAPTSA